MTNVTTFTQKALETYERFLRETLMFRNPDVVIWNGDFTEQVQSVFAEVTGDIAKRQRNVLVEEGYGALVDAIDARVFRHWREGSLS